MSITFEGYERRINQIRPVMDKYGIKDFEDAKKICNDNGFKTSTGIERMRSISSRQPNDSM